MVPIEVVVVAFELASEPTSVAFVVAPPLFPVRKKSIERIETPAYF